MWREKLSTQRITGRLKEKRKQVKRTPIRGVLGEEKWALERLKAKAFSLLDRLITTDFSSFEHIDAAFFFLEAFRTEKEDFELAYKQALKPYPKKVKRQVEHLLTETKTSQIENYVYLPSELESQLRRTRRMPLVHYLQTRVIAHRLLYYGLSGLFLVRKYVLGSLSPRKIDNRIRREQKENKVLKVRLKELHQKMSREKQVLAKLVKIEKHSEDDTFSIKKQGSNWEEEDF